MKGDDKKNGSKNDEKKNGQSNGKPKSALNWIFKMAGLTFLIAIVFSLISELITNTGTIIYSALILAILIILNCVFDIIGTAVAAAELAPFIAMASRKVRGAKEGVVLIKNAEKVSNVCNDVIGDICGIISGAAMAAIIYKIATDYSLVGNSEMWVTILFSAFISAITVAGKAFGKQLAIHRAKDIIFLSGYAISFLKRQENK